MKKIKPSTFYITKAQMTLLMDIGLGEIRPTIYTDRENLLIGFIDYHNSTHLNRNIMLCLINKFLLRINYRECKLEPTKLGIRMLKIKLKNPVKSGIVYVPKHLVKSQDLIISSNHKLKKK